MCSIKLFCLPYAGGSAGIYNKWKEYLNPEVILHPIELAGRGRRCNEPLYKTLVEAVDDVFHIIKSEITQPYALFGHSMGALITYKLIKKIRLLKLPEPHHVFFSGKGAPHIVDKNKKKYHLMDDRTFQEEVVKLGGTSLEFFEHKELVEFVLPMLKNDFRLVEVEQNESFINPFDFNISVLIGKDEDLSPKQVIAWNEYTHKICSIFQFKGGHFFLHDEAETIADLVNVTLLKNSYHLNETYNH